MYSIRDSFVVQDADRRLLVPRWSPSRPQVDAICPNQRVTHPTGQHIQLFLRWYAWLDVDRLWMLTRLA